MRVRLFVEIDLDDEALLKQFGDKLPELTAAGTFEASLANVTPQVLGQLPGVKRIAAVPIPKTLDLLT